MGLRNKLISEENKRSFLVSDTENYEDKNVYARFQVHDPINGKYVITKHEFGELGSTNVLNVLFYEDESIEFAYKKAKEYAQEMLGLGCKCEDRTSFNETTIQKSN